MPEHNFRQEILNNALTREVKKGDMLLRNGEACENFFFVLKGCLRSYTIDKKGKEHVVQFAPEDWIIGDQEAFLETKPAILNIDAIEDSTVKVIRRTAAYKISDLDRDSLIDMNMKYQRRMSVLQKRIIQLISATAEERYKEFNFTYPNLVQRVPQKMIASYLGITPESLSRVRKELVSKK